MSLDLWDPWDQFDPCEIRDFWNPWDLYDSRLCDASVSWDPCDIWISCDPKPSDRWDS